MGVTAPAVGTPGGTPGVYSNTNYQLLCQLLERVTGATAEKCITQNVIERAGLRGHRASDRTAYQRAALADVRGVVRHDRPAARLQRLRHVLGGAGGFADIDRCGSQPLLRFAACRRDRQLTSSLAQMQRTVPVISFEGKRIDYGLGLHKMEIPGHGTFWGHDGTVWGAGAMSMTRADGKRQMSVAVNLMQVEQAGLFGEAAAASDR